MVVRRACPAAAAVFLVVAGAAVAFVGLRAQTLEDRATGPDFVEGLHSNVSSVFGHVRAGPHDAFVSHDAVSKAGKAPAGVARWDAELVGNACELGSAGNLDVDVHVCGFAHDVLQEPFVFQHLKAGFLDELAASHGNEEEDRMVHGTDFLGEIGYEYTKLFKFYRGLYGGSKLQNHALNSRVNGEFLNKLNLTKEPIVINNGKYALHVDYLYVDGKDISRAAIAIIEKYIELLKEKDHQLETDIETFSSLGDLTAKKLKIKTMLGERTEARIFEIISYAILKQHYSSVVVYFGFDKNQLSEEKLTLYKTGRTNANDGGIDFVMRPLGRFFQVTEVDTYDKYLLDIDKVMHFPITFVIKTLSSKSQVEKDLKLFIEERSGGMQVVKRRYEKAIEEVITINELLRWIEEMDEPSIDGVFRDIELYYRLEMNIE